MPVYSPVIEVMIIVVAVEIHIHSAQYQLGQVQKGPPRKITKLTVQKH